MQIEQQPSEDVTPCFAIFGPNQIEYPGFYVVRRFLIQEGIDPMPDYIPTAIVSTLEDARKHIPDGAYKLRRWPGDDVSLVECYLI
jgi:hypothetical protein